MNVSLNLVNQFVDLSNVSTDDMLGRIGAQLGAVEEVIDWRGRFSKAVVARVVSCQKHPDADKLQICLIDDNRQTPEVERNSEGFVQVVCGAPNVRAGLLVVWLPPGAIVPSTLDKDPFALGARELRGVMSNGMLASAAELGISDDHSGIVELPNDISIGVAFGEQFGLDDIVIDCENKMFTHRPDCFGVLGVARELAGICGTAFTSPDWYQLKAVDRQSPAGRLNFTSHNQVTTQVPRFMAQVVENVVVKPSRLEVQTALARQGSRAINNIVDFTNYYMHITAQPTHAFDYDKVKALCAGEVTVFPRMALEGEKLQLLNGKEVTLTAQDIVIATDQQAIALAGVMGGAATEVDQNTRNIIVECANFDMYTIRRTSMRHGIFSDAVTRFNKGQSHLQNPVVLQKLVQEICLDTGATAGIRFDSAPEEDGFCWEPVSVTTGFINARLGSNLSPQEIQTLLQNVEFQVDVQDDQLIITPPFWRKDIELAEDIVEEVGRLHGFDTLPVVLPKRSTAPAAKHKLLCLQSRLRSSLSRAGANEILSYSFVSGKLLEDVGQSTKEAYQLSNALSPELQYYRLTLTPSLLSKVHQNIKAGYDRFALFEIGKTHIKLQGVNEEGLPEENNMLSLIYAANDQKIAADEGAAFYHAKAYLERIAAEFGMQLDYAPLAEQSYEITKPYQAGRSALITDRITGNYIGIVGEFRPSVRRSLKLPLHSAGFEILQSPLLEMKSHIPYTPLARYPGTTQDITFKCGKELTYSDLNSAVTQAIDVQANQHDYRVTLTPLSIFHKEKSKSTNTSFRLHIHHPERSVTTEEINTIVETICQAVETQVNVKRV